MERLRAGFSGENDFYKSLVIGALVGTMTTTGRTGTLSEVTFSVVRIRRVLTS